MFFAKQVVSNLHRKKIGHKRMLVSYTRDSSLTEINTLRCQVAGLLKTVQKYFVALASKIRSSEEIVWRSEDEQSSASKKVLKSTEATKLLLIVALSYHNHLNGQIIVKFPSIGVNLCMNVSRARQIRCLVDGSNRFS
ncbi:uncharacterized protein LOC128865148 isoform X1 [Anastrepha ludens]|uniref:uncharacterized protein LOC128865148 isoform X1 n=1 Tax=Anastrepha ludens TaxID=28586 RepID=UPI0023AF96D9|nr:uncharacterized protein LOC128865148 isoform X1 [Anastrepha ludens]XP_053961173.1 uncharacterized protein LOC128865148 isoform X1 [Anastrepha ludens]